MKALEIKEFNKKLKNKNDKKERTLKCWKANLKQSKR